MERKDNYLLQVLQAKQIFLRYDQKKIIEKLKIKHDRMYLYTTMLGESYRICRTSGDLARLDGESWVNTNDHGEYMTLLDLVCDSRPDRWLSHKWVNTAALGRHVHQTLTESRDPLAEAVQERPEAFRTACEAMGGTPVKMGDICYAIELFDGLCIALQFWEGDEEFPPKVNILWDENALMYLKYETIWFATGLLKRRITEKMKTLTD